jgi:5'-3' exoribonuclease 2
LLSSNKLSKIILIKPQPESFEEMLINIYEYIDRLVKLTRPKKILYIAIDGVAPRAKMNQQRSRRFRAAFEAEIQRQRDEKLIQEWSTKGVFIPERKKNFDSNIITPGTEFMSDISSGIKGYITSKLQNDLVWKNLNVIYNDANVSGEGEHKILEFIKSQRG